MNPTIDIASKAFTNHVGLSCDHCQSMIAGIECTIPSQPTTVICNRQQLPGMRTQISEAC